MNDQSARIHPLVQAVIPTVIETGPRSERAFDILVWRSQETNVKVRDLSARFLAAFTGRLPTEVLSDLDHTLLTVT